MKILSRKRWGRIIMYIFFTGSAIASVINPALLGSDQVGQGMIFLISIVVLLGASTALLGSVVDIWLAEYTVLPILSFGLGSYGIAAIVAANQERLALQLVFGLVMLACAAGLEARWRDVRALARIKPPEPQSKGE